MRDLLPIIQNVSHQLKSVFMANLSGHSEYFHAGRVSHDQPWMCTASVEIDVLPWLSRSALDCICEGVLGYHSNAIDLGNDNQYTEALRMLGCVCFRYLKAYIHSFP